MEINSKTFEDIKHTKDYELNFEKIIHKAMISYENSSINVIDHFTDINKMVQSL